MAPPLVARVGTATTREKKSSPARTPHYYRLALTETASLNQVGNSLAKRPIYMHQLPDGLAEHPNTVRTPIELFYWYVVGGWDQRNCQHTGVLART